MSRPVRSEPAVSGPVRLGILRMGNSRLAHELLQGRMFPSGSRSAIGWIDVRRPPGIGRRRQHSPRVCD
ncbi:hypothetical protein ABZ923_30695 [Streptomyces sp. NPDC046881]|uniref:hypothetical protein n=1 Tax=Streptomyces sp. NPDC046881 TaxID=3155374 RepID=UPI0033C541EA